MVKNPSKIYKKLSTTSKSSVKSKRGIETFIRISIKKKHSRFAFKRDIKRNDRKPSKVVHDKGHKPKDCGHKNHDSASGGRDSA